MKYKKGFICLNWLCFWLSIPASQGLEWKKVYSLTHPAKLGTKGFFKDHSEALNKNADNEDADMFSILYQLEQYRTCNGDFHFKLCYPELAENFSFPCNEWTQFNDPAADSIVRNFKPIKITFKSALGDFKGLGMSERSKKETLIEDNPMQFNNRTFSIGTLKGKEGKIVGPPDHLVEKVELFVNPDKQMPTIITNKKNEGDHIFDECSDKVWNAPEGAVGEDAEIVIDMKCPIKLLQIQLRNGVGDFSTREFSVSGSHSSSGPWSKVYTGELKEGATESGCCTNKSLNSGNCSSSIKIPLADSIYLEKTRFYKFEVDSFYGKGGGLEFFRLNGTKLGSFIQKKINTKDAKCTNKQQSWSSWRGYECNKTVDEDLTSSSFWYTIEWQGAIGTWISIEMPRPVYLMSLRLLQANWWWRQNKKVEVSFQNGEKFTAFTLHKFMEAWNEIEVPGGIVLSTSATVRITLLEVFTLSYNGWSEIEFHGIEDLELLNQLIWRKASMKTAIVEGKSPAIRYADRTWNDKSSGINITTKSPTEKTYYGQTFCIRSMFSSFMVDDSNILGFEGGGNSTSKVKYSVEFWIFKPEKNGQQFGQLILNLGDKANQFSNILSMDEVILPFEWHSFCISIHVGLKQATVFHNGHIQAIQFFGELDDEIEDQFKFMTTGHLGGAKFVGKLIDFEVFGKPLSDQELLQWTLCQNQERGDLFSLQLQYKQLTFDLENANILMEAQALTVKGMCRDVNKTSVNMEAFQDNIDKAVKNAGAIFCDTLNGEIIGFPKTETKLFDLNDYKSKVLEQTELETMAIIVNAKSYSIDFPKPEMGFPKGYLDIYEIGSESLILPEEKVLQSLSKVRSSYQSREELCYIMTTKTISTGEKGTTSSFTTQMCSRFGNWWTVCKFDQKIAVSLSGLCKTSPLDKLFYLLEPARGSTDRYGTFGGVTGWLIEFDTEESVWKIHNKGFPENTLKMLDSSRRPFGKKTWEVGHYVCAEGNTVPVVLTLSNCYDDQFTCNDGTCIPLANRCNKKPDCKDVSDEKQCKIVALDETSYLKDDAPPPIIEGEKLNVTLNLEVISILDLQEVDQVLNLKFDLLKFWLDSRLQFYNLKEDLEMNSLVLAEKAAIWVPKIIFSNTRNDNTSINDEMTYTKVSRNTKVNGTQISNEMNEDILVFQGSQNEIRMNRVYEIDFICNYDMRFYPFDIQTCTVDLVVDKNADKFLKLQPGNLIYSGGSTFSQYYIMSYDIYSEKIKGKDGVKVSIVLGRRLLNVILTAYIPTILLNAIGHSTNYFKSFFFEAVITVNLTCMLVLATMFIGIVNGLPKTAYLKMMDYWLVFNLILPFIEVLLHTYMERLSDEDILAHHGPVAEEPTSDQVDTIFVDDEHDEDLPVDVVKVKSANKKENLKNAIEEKAKEAQAEKRARNRAFAKKISLTYNPSAALAFVVVYWVIGLENAQFF